MNNDEIQKVSLISLKLGTPILYAELIFLYFQVAAEQSCYGLTMGDLPARGGFPCRLGTSLTSSLEDEDEYKKSFFKSAENFGDC